MAPRHRLSLFVVAAALLLLSGGSVDGGTTTDGYLGDKYIGCLEMVLGSRCIADPTVPCVEDAILECTLQAAAAAPGAATRPAAAPLAGGGAELLLGAIGGVVARGAISLGVNYIECAAVNLAGKCFVDPTMGCVEEALACN